MVKYREIHSKLTDAERKLEAAALNLSVTIDCLAETNDSITNFKTENSTMQTKIEKMMVQVKQEMSDRQIIVDDLEKLKE